MIICAFIVYLNHCPHVLIKIYEFLKRLVEYFKKHGEYQKVSKIFLLLGGYCFIEERRQDHFILKRKFISLHIITFKII